MMVPGNFYCRLKHIEVKPYTVKAELVESGSTNTYTLSYPELERSLSITYNSEFPYEIESFEVVGRGG